MLVLPQLESSPPPTTPPTTTTPSTTNLAHWSLADQLQWMNAHARLTPSPMVEGQEAAPPPPDAAAATSVSSATSATNTTDDAIGTPFLAMPLPPDTPVTSLVRDHLLVQNGLLYSAVPQPICTADLLAEHQYTHSGYWSLDALKDEDDWPAHLAAASEADRLAMERDVEWPLDTTARTTPPTPPPTIAPPAATSNASEALSEVARILRREERDRTRAHRQPTRVSQVRQLREALRFRPPPPGSLLTKIRAPPQAFDAALAGSISAAFVRRHWNQSIGQPPPPLQANTRARAWEPIYTPAYCHMLPISYAALVQSGSLRGQRWLFLGDSLTRYSFVAFMYFLTTGTWSAHQQIDVRTSAARWDERAAG
ncbi:MAG: hypothetical protein P4L83_11955 [Nevskia sp.]|nr:hypothetical protein [Nevskia sp.]